MLQFAEPCWARVSEPARDMVRRLLDPDEARRMTAEQALCHPWPVRVVLCLCHQPKQLCITDLGRLVGPN